MLASLFIFDVFELHCPCNFFFALAGLSPVTAPAAMPARLPLKSAPVLDVHDG